MVIDEQTLVPDLPIVESSLKLKDYETNGYPIPTNSKLSTEAQEDLKRAAEREYELLKQRHDQQVSKLYVTYKLRGKYGSEVDEGLENCIKGILRLGN